MDHLARIAMKNAANCVKYGEMQGYRNRYMSNAYCGPVIYLTGPHLSEGLLKSYAHLAVVTLFMLPLLRSEECATTTTSLGIHSVVMVVAEIGDERVDACECFLVPVQAGG